MTNKILATLKKVQLSWSSEEAEDGSPLLVSHGLVKTSGRELSVQTAISISEDGASSKKLDFATHVGQIHKNRMGFAILNELNHNFDGKLVGFDSVNPSIMDIVYSTSYPIDWVLRQDRVKTLIAAHAENKALIAPILEEAITLKNTQETDFHQVQVVAYHLVRSKLGIAALKTQPAFKPSASESE